MPAFRETTVDDGQRAAFRRREEFRGWADKDSAIFPKERFIAKDLSDTARLGADEHDSLARAEQLADIGGKSA